MSEQDLFAVVGRQRAHRAFDPDRPVSDDLIERVLDAARFAPSSENTQPWAFVVVREATTRAELTGLMERLWSAAADAGLADAADRDVDAGLRGGFATAPVWVVVGGDEVRIGAGDLAASVFPAVQNLLLAATALGLGSAMTTIATYAPDAVRRLAGLPEHVRPLALVPLGWPARPLRRPGRRPLLEIAHRERYGSTW